VPVAWAAVRIGRWGALAVAAAVLVQCAAPPDRPDAPDSPSTPAPAPPPRPPTVSPVTAADLGASWRPGCPVDPDGLRRVELDHWASDGRLHRGELIVAADMVDAVIEVFTALRDQRYPIEKMRSVAAYPGAEDEVSMRDNNTSAFNCRGISGSQRWSWHAYGRAVDINPLVNPSVDADGRIEPATGGPWLDRSRTYPGMLHDGDPAVTAFLSRGWRWGGHWHSPKDYQHFEMGTR